MPDTTDLQTVKRIAKKLLYLDIKKTPFSPIVVHHPFTDTALTAVKDASGFRMIDLLEDPAGLQQWQKEKLHFIDRAEDVHRIFVQVTKPYALAFLREIEGCLSQEDLASILRETWMRIEFVSDNPIYSKAQFARLFRSCDKTQLMDPDEFAQYQALPETVEIYRGVREGSKKVKGMSWTIDPAVAKWFAKRFANKDSAGDVYRATISKKDVLAVFLGRSESEVVVDIKGLRDVEKISQKPVLDDMLRTAAAKSDIQQIRQPLVPEAPHR